MKALVGAFNQKKALVGAFSVIVQPVVEPMEHYTALFTTNYSNLDGGIHSDKWGEGFIEISGLRTSILEGMEAVFCEHLETV